MSEKAPVVDYDFEDLTARRLRDFAGLRKAKELESRREHVYVRTDFQTVKMIEKSKYERLYHQKTKNHEVKSV